MPNRYWKYSIKSFVLIILVLSTAIGNAQTRDLDIHSMNKEIDRLSNMLTKLKAEQANSNRLALEINSPGSESPRRDKQRLQALRNKQAESRSRIDALTQEIVKISKQLEDPNKRFALAKRMQRVQTVKLVDSESSLEDTSIASETISARSIDLSAVKLVRQGKTLDQARLLVIDKLSKDQVLNFYQTLDKQDRFELYDIADEIVLSEDVEVMEARRSAIYFYFYTQ